MVPDSVSGARCVGIAEGGCAGARGRRRRREHDHRRNEHGRRGGDRRVEREEVFLVEHVDLDRDHRIDVRRIALLVFGVDRVAHLREDARRELRRRNEAERRAVRLSLLRDIRRP